MSNSVTLLGRLTRPPEAHQISADRSVVNFAIAVDRPYKDAAGNRPTDFWDIQAWGKLGELVMQFTDKGGRILVEGRYQRRSYQATDGTPRTAHEIVANTVAFVDFKDSESAPVSDDMESIDPEDDDLPF